MSTSEKTARGPGNALQERRLHGLSSEKNNAIKMTVTVTT